MSSKKAASEPQDWTQLEIHEPVTVIEPRGYRYHAVIEDKMPDSSIVWIRRTDSLTRHLIEMHDGTHILPRERRTSGGATSNPVERHLTRRV